MIGDPTNKVPEYPGILSSIDQHENLAYGSGVSLVFPEVDGVTRRMPLVIKSGDTLYPSMGLEVLRILAGDPSFQIKFSDIGIDKLRVPQFGIVSTDPIGRIWIDSQQRPTTYSLSELPETFDSAIVIVGTTASGITNPIATSRGEVWPHEMQASVVATLASGITIQRPDWAPGSELLALVVLTFTLLFLETNLKRRTNTITCGSNSFNHFFIQLLENNRSNTIINVSPPIITKPSSSHLNFSATHKRFPIYL